MAGRRHGAGMTGSKPKDAKKAVRRIFSYMKEDWLKIVIVLFLVILNTVASLAGSYMLRPVINSLTGPDGSVEKLLVSVFIMAAIYLVAVAASYLQMRIIIGVSQKALQRIRNDLFSRVQKLPVRFYDTNSHGDIMSRFSNDVDAIGEMMNNTIIQVISAAISVVGTFGLMLYTNLYLTLITVVLLPLMMSRVGS